MPALHAARLRLGGNTRKPTEWRAERRHAVGRRILAVQCRDRPRLWRHDYSQVLSFARVLHDPGVPLMIGTDGTGGGPIYARELHNHVLAGIPAWEVLRMATSGNATLMGLGRFDDLVAMALSRLE